MPTKHFQLSLRYSAYQMGRRLGWDQTVTRPTVRIASLNAFFISTERQQRDLSASRRIRALVISLDPPPFSPTPYCSGEVMACTREKKGARRHFQGRRGNAEPIPMGRIGGGTPSGILSDKKIPGKGPICNQI